MRKKLSLALTAGGMASLLLGSKTGALTLFGLGAAGLEKSWRDEHPEVPKTFSDRWEAAISFYRKTHSEPTNRSLHRIGIPMILGGTAGLLLFPSYRPMWLLSAASFTVGWGLNFVGHGLYEKNKPAFADDPLSFIAGPIWDLEQIKADKALRVVDSTREAV